MIELPSRVTVVLGSGGAGGWMFHLGALRALRAEAESRAAVLDVDGAVDRLRAARDQGRTVAGTDHLELSIIDARYRQLAQRQRELAMERQP